MTSAYRLTNPWQPVWWEPELWAGATWHLTTILHGVTAGTVTGAVLWMDGRQFPVTVTDTLVHAELTPDQVGTLTNGAAAQLYLDVADVGRVLWLHGNVVHGGDPIDYR